MAWRKKPWEEVGLKYPESLDFLSIHPKRASAHPDLLVSQPRLFQKSRYYILNHRLSGRVRCFEPNRDDAIAVAFKIGPVVRIQQRAFFECHVLRFHMKTPKFLSHAMFK